MQTVHARTKSPSVVSEPQALLEPAVERRAELRVALAQIAPILGDRPRNVDKHLASIETARQQGADLVIFPELSLTGYFLRDMVPEVALCAHQPRDCPTDRSRQPSVDRGGFCRGSGRPPVLQRGLLCRSGSTDARASQGLSANLRAVRGAALLLARQAVPSLSFAASGPRGNADLRGLLACFRRHGDAGRGGRRLDRFDQFSGAASRARKLPRRKRTSFWLARSRSCWERW